MKMKVARTSLIEALEKKRDFYKAEIKKKEVDVFLPVKQWITAAEQVSKNLQENIKAMKAAKTQDQQNALALKPLLYSNCSYKPALALAMFERGEVTKLNRLINTLNITTDQFISLTDNSDYLQYL